MLGRSTGHEEDGVDLVPMVTNRLEGVTARRLICEACGSEFSCDPTGSCWCFEENIRLPMPAESKASRFSDCLCRGCLRNLAKQQAAATE